MKNNKSPKVAILTHFNVCNFGANMQALSTFSYLRNNGYDPIFIDWVGYQKELFTNIPKIQKEAHTQFIKTYLTVSPPLYNENEIIKYLRENAIFNIIVGSDAVFSLNTWYDRIKINKRGIHLLKSSPDKIFPNVFWLNQLINDPQFRIAMMSVSSQNAIYQLIPYKTKQNIRKCLNRYNYISVRDYWTQKMVKNISQKDVNVTPDPMWAFNTNYPLADDKENFLKNLNIDSPYILLGFQNAYVKKTKKWLDEFITIAHKERYQCIPLPFSFGYITADYDTQIKFPLSPIDWYKLIKYSNGYVGYNMHPAIVCMANNIPCFSLDNYGINILKYFNIRTSSKIYDIYKSANKPNYCKTLKYFFDSPDSSPQQVMNLIANYDYKNGNCFLEKQIKEYSSMMNNISNLFSK